MKKYHFFGLSIILLLFVILFACKKEENNPEDNNPKWETVFFDDFNRPDGEIGTDYSVQIAFGSGSTSISNKRLMLEKGGFYAIRYAKPVPDDIIRISLKCTIGENTTSALGFGVSGKSQNLGTDWEMQELYGGWMYMNDQIGIMKLTGSTLEVPEPLIAKPYDVKINIPYLLEFTIDNMELTLNVTDLNSNITETVSIIDSGNILNGNIISINGYQGDSDIIFFDDLKIEKFE